MTRRKGNCDRVHDLWEAQTFGAVLSEKDRRLVKDHLDQCADCRVEAGILGEMAFDGTSGPAPELDDLSRRRWIDDVMDIVSRQDSGAANVSQSRTWRTSSFAAAAAIAVLAVSAILWSAWPSFVAQSNGEEAIGYVASDKLAGTLLLSSGDVRVGGEVLGLGSTLEQGSRISMARGHAVMELTDGISVFMDEGAQVEIRELGQTLVDLFVKSGRIIVQVNPDHDGPPLLVTTDDGSIAVTGTVFSVAVVDGRSSVSVFRGSVKLKSETGQVRPLRLGEEAVLGREGVTQISREGESAVSDMLRTLELLTSKEGIALEIDSVPAGAAVFVDGVELGITPVRASVRAGYRRLDIKKEGFESVRELLELGVERKLTRVFELGELSQTEVASSVTSETARRKTSDSKKISPVSTGPVATPAEMIARAQVFRMERNWAAAVGAYGDLIDAHPSSAQARAALVSMGNIQLENLNKPRAALKVFDAYLARFGKGTLAREASFGRANALRALGKSGQERAALESFLRDYPDSILAQRVKTRLDEI